MPRSLILVHDSLQTQMSQLPAPRRKVQIMLYRMKILTLVLVVFQRQEQSLPEVCQEWGESCQMTLESKCQMTKENKSTDLVFQLF